jgi:hypothetical protein
MVALGNLTPSEFANTVREQLYERPNPSSEVSGKAERRHRSWNSASNWIKLPKTLQPALCVAALVASENAQEFIATPSSITLFGRQFGPTSFGELRT